MNFEAKSKSDHVALSSNAQSLVFPLMQWKRYTAGALPLNFRTLPFAPDQGYSLKELLEEHHQ